MGEHLEVSKWRVLSEERGRIPMTDADFPVRRSARTTAIGVAAGAARPSGGYAFARTVMHADAVARAVARGVGSGATLGARTRSDPARGCPLRPGLAGAGTLRRGRREITPAGTMDREILREIERGGHGAAPGRAIVSRRRKVAVALPAALFA